MTTVIGTRLGPYEILSLLGAGGMGDVYRARDTKLNRDAAIKILPDPFAQDEERVGRFKREAQVLASLNHPNIAVIYGVEESDGIRALVMELVEGPTLAERIASGDIPIDEALSLARQIAEAIEAAHERGIIHRDLKPANVKVTSYGTVKVLDFGLAKVLEEQSPETDLSHSPTLIKGTQAGVILGTAAYMSPEQAKGKGVDKRSDIWAFGCLLFEMLSGQQTFSGETLTDTLAAVVRAEPEWSALPATTPATIRKLLERCLTKDLRRRLRDIGEARIAIESVEARKSEDTPEPAARKEASPSRNALLLAAAALLVAVALTSGIAYLVVPRQSPLNLRAAINLPAGFRLDSVNSSLALSPDGAKLAFAATGTDSLQRLWIRPMNGLEAQALTGTDGATYPFWSPDGRSLGFFSNHKLKTIELGTGAVRTLCDAPNGRGASWGGRGMIVFAPDYQTELFTIPDSGGTPVQVTTLKESRETHRNPFFLADGQHVLFVRGTQLSPDGIYWLDLDTGRTDKVIDSPSQALYADGYLIFVRGTALMAQPFDTKTLEASGQAVIVAEDIQWNPPRYAGEFSVSQTGMLVYATGTRLPVSRLTMYGEDGHKLSDIGQPAIFSEEFQISHDGRKIAATVVRPDDTPDIWIFDINGGNGRRLTFAADGRTGPLWSRDNRSLVFQDLKGQVYEQPQDGSAPERNLVQLKAGDFITSLSPDGEFLSVSTSSKGGLDIMVMPVKGGEPKPLAITPAWETVAMFSPDGKWLAYMSDETGRYELFVVPFPGGQGKFQVSSGGGQSPVWINGGRELAYVNDQRKLVAVEIRSSGMQMEVGQARMLFGGQALPVLPGLQPGDFSFSPVYMSPDGKRVVLAVPTNLSSERPLNLITNWRDNLGLKR